MPGTELGMAYSKGKKKTQNLCVLFVFLKKKKVISKLNTVLWFQRTGEAWLFMVQRLVEVLGEHSCRRLGGGVWLCAA